MELLIAGILVSIFVLLIGGFVCSFIVKDDNSSTSSSSSSHLEGQQKILTQDGMVVKKSSIDKPLFLMGDSKVIHKA